MADDVAVRADRLLAMWSELSMRHVALGAGCACGVGGVSLRLEDFELDIVGYLEDNGLRSGLAAVEQYFTSLAQSGVRDEPLRAVLQDIRRGEVTPVVADWLLPKVERTLRSFAELHGPRSQE